MVKLIGLIRKRPDLTFEVFRDHWLGTHAQLARQLPGLRRYTVNIIDRARYPASAYDGFSELWFDSQEALDSAFAPPAVDALAADIPRFIGELTRVVVEEHEMLRG